MTEISNLYNNTIECVLCRKPYKEEELILEKLILDKEEELTILICKKCEDKVTEDRSVLYVLW